MFVLIGLAVVFASIIAGYTMHGGQLLILFQISEFLIIGGAAIGALLISNPPDMLRRIVQGVLATLRGNKLSKAAYLELLQFLFEIFQLAKREGLIALEQHVENPHSSAIFSKYPTVLANHHAVDFFCDTMKVVLNGGVPPHDLEDLMELDLETIHQKESRAPAALITIAPRRRSSPLRIRSQDWESLLQCSAWLSPWARWTNLRRWSDTALPQPWWGPSWACCSPTGWLDPSDAA